PVIVHEGFKDTEDLDGFFSGWDAEKGEYDPATWQYAGMSVHGAAGQREMGAVYGEQAGHGGHAASLDHGEPPEEDFTLQHSRCAVTRRSRDRRTCRRCSTRCPATSRCRTPARTRT